jgi:hypothetical protein
MNRHPAQNEATDNKLKVDVQTHTISINEIKYFIAFSPAFADLVHIESLYLTDLSYKPPQEENKMEVDSSEGDRGI